MECSLNDLFKCDTKRSDLEKRYASDSQAERKINHIILAHQNSSGCNKHLDSPLHFIDQFGYHSCLCNFKNPLINYFNVITDQWEKGVFPHQGCLSDQCARLIDVIYLIKSLRQDHLDKLQDQLEKRR